MNEKEVKAFWNSSIPCDKRGFQREAGFAIDETKGALELLIVKCHSDKHPVSKNRVVMVVPNEDGSSPPVFRIHDRVVVQRLHGKQLAHDKWTMKTSAGKRFLRWCGQQITVYRSVILAKLKEIIERKVGLQ